MFQLFRSCFYFGVKIISQQIYWNILDDDDDDENDKF